MKKCKDCIHSCTISEDNKNITFCGHTTSVALKVEHASMWNDVDGLMNSDPAKDCWYHTTDKE